MKLQRNGNIMRKGADYICNNKSCGHVGKVQVRIFDQLDDCTCKYCDTRLVHIPRKHTQLVKRDKRAKQELKEMNS